MNNRHATTLSTLAAVLLGALTLALPGLGQAGEGYRSAAMVDAGYRERGEHRDYDRRDRHRGHYRGRGQDHHHRHYVRRYYPAPYYYRPYYPAPRYYDHGRSGWDLDLRYRFSDRW